MSKSAPPPQAGIISSHSAPAGDEVFIEETRFRMRRVVHTIKLARAIKATKLSVDKRMLGVADLLKEDAVRSDPLIDLSCTVEGDKSCVLFQLLHFFQLCTPFANEPSFSGAPKQIAMSILDNQILSRQKLLRSFDPSAVEAESGNNALHVLAPLDPPPSCTVIQKLLELFIAHGVSVHARNKEGHTPLIQIASFLTPIHTSTASIRLLLSHGADLNAQNNEGDGLLHLLVKRKALAVLQNLLSGDHVDHMDWFLTNSAGQTAVDVTAHQLAQMEASPDRDQTDEFWTHRLLLSYQKTWTAYSRPILQRCVEAVLVPDLAAIVLGYVDGSGKPFPAAADSENAEESPAPAVAVAVAPAQ